MGEKSNATLKEVKANKNLLMFVYIKLNGKAVCIGGHERNTQFHNKPRSKAIRIKVDKEFELHKGNQFVGKAYFWIGKGSRHLY